MPEYKMKPSKVLDKLRSGEVVNCVKLNTTDRSVAELAAMAGFDCLWLDFEHVPCDYSELATQILVAKAYGADIMVRVARGGYSDYIRPLEMDASGIMVPHIMSLADAKYVARTTRFHPVGRRPVDGGNADGAYTNIEFTEYIASANRNRFVMAQIEDPEPLAELDAIAAVEGIDVLFFGPGDFSHGIGAPAQFDQPEVVRARSAVAEAAARHGKFAGTVGSPANYAELVAMGYRFINIGADVVGLGQYFGNLLKGIGK